MSSARISPSEPARARSAAATRSEPELLSSAMRLLTEVGGEQREVVAGAREDRAEARIEYPEGAGAGEAHLVPVDGGAAAHEREEAAVVLVARPLRGVDRVGVAPVEDGHFGQHAPERGIPFERVVTPGLPGVDEHRLADATRVALLEQEAMPGQQRGQAGAAARPSSGCRSNRSRAQVAATGGCVMPEMRRPSTLKRLPHQRGPGR